MQHQKPSQKCLFFSSSVKLNAAGLDMWSHFMHSLHLLVSMMTHVFTRLRPAESGTRLWDPTLHFRALQAPAWIRESDSCGEFAGFPLVCLHDEMMFGKRLHRLLPLTGASGVRVKPSAGKIWTLPDPKGAIKPTLPVKLLKSEWEKEAEFIIFRSAGSSFWNLRAAW